MSGERRRIAGPWHAVKKRSTTKSETRSTDYAWLLIFSAVLIAYFPALNGSVLWDDLGHITFPELRSFGGLWRIWTELGATQQYYPVLHSAFWLEHRIWGDSMLGYHVANVVLHSTAAFLVVLILRQLAVPGALLAGMLFALHPIAVESVAWISEQKNTLSAVFYLASAYVYLRFVDDRGGATEQNHRLPATDYWLPASGYWLALALFICALLSKTVTATLPAALLLVVWWQRGRLEWRRDVLPLVPWFVIAVAAGAFTIWFEHQVIGAKGADFTLTLAERIILAGRVIWFYLGKLFWPGNLIFVYPRWTIDASVWWQYLLPAGGHCAGDRLCAASRNVRRGPLAGYLFFCGTLVPVLGFVNVYPFLFSYVADHFQYLASLGIIVPVASALTIVSGQPVRWQRRAATIAGAVIVVALGVLTWNRSGVYVDAETLFRDTIARNPQAWMAYLNLGTELASQNRLTEAIDAYDGALRLRPDAAEAKRNLVLAHMKLGDALAGKPDRHGEADRALRGRDSNRSRPLSCEIQPGNDADGRPRPGS